MLFFFERPIHAGMPGTIPNFLPVNGPACMSTVNASVRVYSVPAPTFSTCENVAER